MLKIAQSFTLAAMVLCAVGCEDKKVGERISKLEAEVAVLREFAVFSTTQQMTATLDKQALIDTGAQGFAAFQCRAGTLMVSVHDISPYADGSRVTFKFGNPTTAKIDGFSFDIDYGPKGPEGGLNTDRKQNKSVTLLKPLAAGSWTTEEVRLPSVKPEDLGMLRLFNFGSRGIQLVDLEALQSK